MSSAAAVTRGLVQLVARIVLLLLPAAAVAGLAFLLLGPPSLARELRRNEIARFSPTFGHGMGQLAGESFLLVLIAFSSRRWLRIRL